VWNCLPTSLKRTCSIYKFKKTIKIYLQSVQSRIFDTVWPMENHYFSKIYNVIYQILCSVRSWPLFVWVCICVLITWSLSLLWAASWDERFFAFLAARHRAILFSIFVLLIFIARWQINMMTMILLTMLPNN